MTVKEFEVLAQKTREKREENKNFCIEWVHTIYNQCLVEKARNTSKAQPEKYEYFQKRERELMLELWKVFPLNRNQLAAMRNWLAKTEFKDPIKLNPTDVTDIGEDIYTALKEQTKDILDYGHWIGDGAIKEWKCSNCGGVFSYSNGHTCPTCGITIGFPLHLWETEEAAEMNAANFKNNEGC